MDSEKKLYTFQEEDGFSEPILLSLTRDQVAILLWMKELGYDFKIKKVDNSVVPEDISGEKWVKDW